MCCYFKTKFHGILNKICILLGSQPEESVVLSLARLLLDSASPFILSLSYISDIMIYPCALLGYLKSMSSRIKVPFLCCLTECLKTDGMSRAYDRRNISKGKGREG